MNKRLRRAAATVPLLLVTVACQAGGTDGAAGPAATPSSTVKPVFEQRLDDQLSAATQATRASGSARFTSTVTYGSAKGTAVERTTGVLDYTKGTARVERSFDVPRRFPQDAAFAFGREPGAEGRETYRVEGSTIDYRTGGGTWLRYSASASMEFAEKIEDFLTHAGDAAPWGRTLAEVVTHADPEKNPSPTDGGGRRYQVTVEGREAADALPPELAEAFTNDMSAEVALTVDVDKGGRLLRAESDYTPILEPLHRAGVLKGVTTLRVAYDLTGHGGQSVPAAEGGEKTEDAEKALTPLDAVKPGACGSLDTGLGGPDLVRAVPCGEKADVRVFGQVRVSEKSVTGDPWQFAEGRADEGCRTEMDAAPDAWTAGSVPRDTFVAWSGNTTAHSEDGAAPTVTGDYACYVELR
ncbi:hypothetical protein OG259_13250 [Streptomyces sp. NBC_00250]|uniref:hypothetical protein n=1 Tax=Streptomyces sp. NBC_00250 TaxID=2903641 RepID=UPI002E2A1C5A|nr:hypothetical protein [Streptomyces sp. NBC_00250]